MKECAELREENAATARALEQETKRAHKEEHGRDKFRGALWGSNSELKLRREERDQSRAHSMVLKEELDAYSRSKRNLSQRLCKTETNMLAIVNKYQEELNLATAHKHKVADEYAQVYAEKEARGRVIDSLHQEATMWMDQFALTLNESQELPRLLAKAKAMAETYSAPEEIHGLLSYSPVQPRAPAPIQREAPQAPAPTTTHPTGNAHFGASSNAMRNFPPRPTSEFTPIPMTYEDLFPQGQPPFPKWYNPDTTCAYHGKTPGHYTEKCLALKYKVQHLIDAGWLTFQEDRPNVKTNPLANHGGGAVNAVESGRPRWSKPLKDMTTPRSELHNIETCLAVENLLQQMIDRGRLEVGDEGREEQHICMQSADERSLGSPKPLVRYAPPSERKEEATDISSLSTKVTNITGLSGVTRSSRVFAPPDLPTQPANVKGKAKMVEEQNDKMTLTLNKDIPVKGLPEKRDGCGKKKVSLEEAGEFLRIIQQSEFKVIEQLNKTLARVSLLLRLYVFCS
ncbi:hypothetical protein HKD37_01G000869 [Glycine soja]